MLACKWEPGPAKTPIKETGEKEWKECEQKVIGERGRRVESSSSLHFVNCKF